MRNVLIVVNDEALIARMKIIYSSSDYEYFYASDGSAAIAIADSNEIAVAVIDFRMPILSGQEICETLSSINMRTQFVFLFEADDIEQVLKFYNKYHITKLICWEEFQPEDLDSYIDDCMHIYYHREELTKMKEKVNAVSEKYLQPMNAMSNLLNERLRCYEFITKIFTCCMDVQFDNNVKGVKALNIFVNRIVDDFIQLFMIKEPDANDFLGNLDIFYNKPDSKKYFKFVGNDVNVDESKLNILFTLNVITICFDTFFPMYRGKIELTENETAIIINSVYEIRYNDYSREVSDRALRICKEVLEKYCDTLKFARKDELIQYKAAIIKQKSEEQEAEADGLSKSFNMLQNKVSEKMSELKHKFDTGSIST